MSSEFEMPTPCQACERIFELNDLYWDMLCRECHEEYQEKAEQDRIERYGV